MTNLVPIEGGPPQGCPTPPDLFPTIVGIIIVLGTQISFIFTEVNILKSRSVVGLSTFTFLTAAISNTVSLYAGVIDNWLAFECCLIQGPWACGRNLIIMIQFSLSFLNYFFIFSLVAAWIKNPKPESKDRYIARLSFVLYSIWFIIGAGLLCGYFLWAYDYDGDITQIFFKVLNYMALATVVLQWVPQIWTTWRLKSSGSLSIFTLILNMIGCAAVIFVSISAGNSALLWVPYAASGAQQVVLVAMLTLFWIRDRATTKTTGVYVAVNVNTAAQDEDDVATKSLLGTSASDQTYDSDSSDRSRAASFSGDELTPAYKFYQTNSSVPATTTYARYN